MFDSDKKNEGVPVEKLQFIIVYDKVTKPVAKCIYNSVSSKYVCSVWSSKTYKQKEESLTNKNKILFMDDSLIKDNLCSPNSEKNITKYVCLIRQNNACAFKLDENKVKSSGNIIKENWGKYIITLVANRLIGVVIMSFYLSLDKNKKIRFKQFLDATKPFIEQHLEKFINDN